MSDQPYFDETPDFNENIDLNESYETELDTTQQEVDNLLDWEDTGQSIETEDNTLTDTSYEVENTAAYPEATADDSQVVSDAQQDYDSSLTDSATNMDEQAVTTTAPETAGETNPEPTDPNDNPDPTDDPNITVHPKPDVEVEPDPELHPIDPNAYPYHGGGPERG